MQCDSPLLWTLVEQQSEPDERSGRVYRHVANCKRCQQSLKDLSGGERWEAKVSESLSLDVLEANVNGASASCDIEHLDESALPIDLSFLQQARHPEMLGRLGRYEIESVIGRGGMGLVLRGYDPELQRTVAIKVLAPEWAATPAARQRFAREAQAAASVAHENVIPIHNVQSEAQPPFLVMRYIAGASLERHVADHGPPDPEMILRIATQLAAGLSAAHRQGLIHRDVKPANVMVGENVERVWLTDFGLARAADDARMTRTGVIAGTPHYMSPEQARGQPLDARSDLFSLGGVLYFLCTGRPPFDAATTLGILHQTTSATPLPVTRFRGDLPPKLVSLIGRLLAKKPSRRPATADRVDEELQVANEQLRQGMQTRKRQIRRRQFVGAIGGLVLIAAFIIAAPLVMLEMSRQKPSAGSRPSAENRPLTNAPVDGQALGDPWSESWIGIEPHPSDQRRLNRIAEQIDAVANWDDARWQERVRRFEQDARRLDQSIDAGFMP